MLNNRTLGVQAGNGRAISRCTLSEVGDLAEMDHGISLASMCESSHKFVFSVFWELFGSQTCEVKLPLCMRLVRQGCNLVTNL